jgi:hypothetical protein
MAASYPTAVKSFTPVVDGVDDVLAAQINAVYDEITALETNLGANVQGSASSLAARLLKTISASGVGQLAAQTDLTISGGSVTLTQNWHTIDTESGAASDFLDTITAIGDGFYAWLKTKADARDVTVRNGVGNILTTSGKDITLGTAADLLFVIYDDVVDKWIAFGPTAGAMTNQVNTWTAAQIFAASVYSPFITINTNTTLDATHHKVYVNASGGPVTVTLPAAATAVSNGAGRDYIIIKIDSSANAVTIDGNGAETINGAATYVISNQWTSISVGSNGTGWIIS